MAKRKSETLAVPSDYERGREPALKKQSPYSNRPWQPGEVPRGFNPVISISGTPTPSGEFWGVEKPTNRSDPDPKRGD